MAHKLAQRAMIDKPVWKPVKDFTYLKDVTVGELVNTNSGLKAVVLEHTECASLVLVLNADNHSNEDKQFYLGKHRWGNKTEVKIIGD
jgi:hypothetical protein